MDTERGQHHPTSPPITTAQRSERSDDLLTVVTVRILSARSIDDYGRTTDPMGLVLWGHHHHHHHHPIMLRAVRLGPFVDHCQRHVHLPDVVYRLREPNQQLRLLNRASTASSLPSSFTAGGAEALMGPARAGAFFRIFFFQCMN